jgi:hypothetical protein
VYGGGYFHLNSGDISEIDILSIASATSRLCRFTGHLIDGVEIYSVAEHSVFVSHILERMGAPPSVMLQGLMHDASEAYLSDIAAPFKGVIGNYYGVEDAIMERIKDRYLLPRKFDSRVRLADWYALFIEARQLVCPNEEELKTWQGYEEYGKSSREYDLPLHCWLPSEGRKQFLARFALVQDLMLGETK